MAPLALRLEGKRFGRLVAISSTMRDGHGKRLWLCQCDCGKTSTVSADKLNLGRTKSCGCLRPASLRQQNSGRIGPPRNNGPRVGRTPEYQAWTGMLQRCTNPKNKYFRDYGGRGITVCARWDSFANFLADVGPRPSPAHSLDRINNDGNYEAGNVRWRDLSWQNHNKRARSNTGIQGVSRSAKTGLFRWSITRNGVTYQGHKRDLSEAVAARAAAEREIYPEESR